MYYNKKEQDHSIAKYPFCKGQVALSEVKRQV